MADNQPRYTTKRLHDEIAKAKAYARREALEEAEAVVADYVGKQSPISAAIRALYTTSNAIVEQDSAPSECGTNADG